MRGSLNGLAKRHQPLVSPLYKRFPELEISRTIKLMAFGQLKKSDPHYVGYGVVHSLFDKNDAKAIRNFHDLIESNDFDSFVKDRVGISLNTSNKVEVFKIKVDAESP